MTRTKTTGLDLWDHAVETKALFKTTACLVTTGEEVFAPNTERTALTLSVLTASGHHKSTCSSTYLQSRRFQATLIVCVFQCHSHTNSVTSSADVDDQ